MSKHTPGPWTVLPGDDFDGGLIVYCAEVERLPDPSHCAKTIVVGGSVVEGERAWTEVEANAHLIAAAPEMLEALREAVYILKICDTGSGKTVARLGALIAKAEGRS